VPVEDVLCREERVPVRRPAPDVDGVALLGVAVLRGEQDDLARFSPLLQQRLDGVVRPLDDVGRGALDEPDRRSLEPARTQLPTRQAAEQLRDALRVADVS
jgi:hypothetical protein